MFVIMLLTFSGLIGGGILALLMRGRPELPSYILLPTLGVIVLFLVLVSWIGLEYTVLLPAFLKGG